jgi:hypothetical protein
MIGAEWDVVARFPTKRVEKIVGFKSEAEAMAWIGSERCMTWIKAMGYA